MYSTPNKDCKESTSIESIYSTPRISFLNETPKTKNKKINNRNRDLLEENIFYDNIEHINNVKIKFDGLFHDVDKEKENFDNSVYFTPTLKSYKQCRTPLTEIKSCVFNHLGRTHVNYGQNSECYTERQVTFSNTQHVDLKMQNCDYKHTSTPTPVHNDVMNNCGTGTPNWINSISCAENDNGNRSNVEGCSSFGSKDGFNFTGDNVSSNSSIIGGKRNWMKSTFPKKSAKRVRNRTLLQKILKLKLLRRIPPTLPLHISFTRPPDLVSSLTRKYSKKLNIFKKLFGRRNAQEKYTKLRNRPPSTSSSGSNSYNTRSKCSNCCHHSNASRVLNVIESITSRLEKIEKDVHDLKNIINQGSSAKTGSGSTVGGTPVPPPLPPPPPPFPLFTVLSLSQTSKGSSASSNSNWSLSKSNNKNAKPPSRHFTITADDIRNVKLKKTPVTLLEQENKKPVPYSDPRLPVISVDMLRSVKLRSNKARRITDKKRQSISPYLSRETSGSRSTASIGRRLTFSKEFRRTAKDCNDFQTTGIYSKFGNDALQKINETDC